MHSARMHTHTHMLAHPGIPKDSDWVGKGTSNYAVWWGWGAGVEGGTEKATPQNGSLQLDLDGTGFPTLAHLRSHTNSADSLLPVQGCSFNSGCPKGERGGQFSHLPPAETQAPVAKGDGDRVLLLAHNWPPLLVEGGVG